MKISNEATKRKTGSIVRIIRDDRIVCQFGLPTKSGHMQKEHILNPFEHNGHDSLDNLLCPSHHVMFDRDSFSIKDELELIGEV